MSFRLRPLVLFALGLFGAAEGGRGQAPSYSAAGIVNAASNVAGALAPNTIVTLYGANLAFLTRAVSPEDIRAGVLPVALPGAGVRVSIGLLSAHIYYVSPTQVNLLIPSNMAPGPAELTLRVDGRAGPAVAIHLAAAAPGLFLRGGPWAVACRPDGSVITEERPARPGEIVVLYATGLGRTVPNPAPGEVPAQAAVLEHWSQFEVLVNGEPLKQDRVLYAGLAPGFPGLYQINLRLPEPAPRNPELRLRLGEDASPAGVLLALEP
ncbi:MAG: hypothetical protein HY822_09540 [Acidobacteria bacterium]|nr:hypothetical protein [Acidobacteriota bacterium]